MAEVIEADFPGNLASMQACDQGPGGYHAVFYRSAGHHFLKPHWVSLGEELWPSDTPEDIDALLDEAELAACSAIDFLRICQASRHGNEERTKRFSSRLELAGSVVLASQPEPLPIHSADLFASRHPHVYHTVRALKVGEDQFLPANALVQDRRRTQDHRKTNKLAAVVLADMSTEENPVYVGLWDENTRFVPLPR